MNILITGTAGFIGFHLAKRLLAMGHTVVGYDSVNDYYSVDLKYARLQETGIAREAVAYGRPVISTTLPRYTFIQGDLADRTLLPQVFAQTAFDCVVNLAAQAGVRYSLENPFAYVDSNLTGFVNVLECARHHHIGHLLYASSSSVYGGNDQVPFTEDQAVDNPVSLYAATKKADELMASCYAHLYGLPATGLRFFTVYGPWGRPDMALFLFADAITHHRPIHVFNNGQMVRDFTYIDDIVEGMVRLLDTPPAPQPNGRRHNVYNIGCSHPVNLLDFIHTLEDALGQPAVMQMEPMQPGDVTRTYASTQKLEAAVGYKPQTTVKEGVGRFVEWYRKTYLTFA